MLWLVRYYWTMSNWDEAKIRRSDAGRFASKPRNAARDDILDEEPDQSGLPPDAKVVPSTHFQQQMRDKGFDMRDAVSALRDPDKVTWVTTRPEFVEAGQFRMCGKGEGALAVVVEPKGNNTFELKTVYLNDVRTPLREDQKNDPYALRSRRAL